MEKISSLAHRIRSRQPVIGLWQHIPHPIVSEILAQSGVDFLLVDGEHSPIQPHSLGNLLPASELHGMPTIYRVAWNRIELIKAALDHGVNGVMVPMVNSPTEALEAANSSKYPPMGKRGMGAWRASNYYLNDEEYITNANTGTALILQIETREALDNVEEIAATPGLDALYIGPADLAGSMGVKQGELNSELIAACKRVSDAAEKNNVAAGIDVASLEYVKTYRDLGFSLLTHGLDLSFISDGGRAVSRDMRSLIS